MIERFYKTHGEIHRKTIEPDGMGSGKINWLAIMTTVGALDQASGGEVNRASKLMYETSHTWFCPVPNLLIVEPEDQATYFGTPFAPSPYGVGNTAKILNGDRLVVDGVNYEITNVDDPMGMGHHLEISVKRLESGQI